MISSSTGYWYWFTASITTNPRVSIELLSFVSLKAFVVHFTYVQPLALQKNNQRLCGYMPTWNANAHHRNFFQPLIAHQNTLSHSPLNTSVLLYLKSHWRSSGPWAKLYTSLRSGSCRFYATSCLALQGLILCSPLWTLWNVMSILFIEVVLVEILAG